MVLASVTAFLKGLLLGLLLAFGLYNTILSDLGIDLDILRPFGLALAVVLGLSCAVSPQVQCVGLICATMFCSKNGRRTLQAMILALLITGPGNNMIHNTKEVVRTFGCAAELAYNVSKEYAYLTVTPFTKALLKLNQNHADSVTRAVQSVQKQITPLHEMINPQDDGDGKAEETADSEDYPMKSTIIDEKYKTNPDDTDGDKIEKKFLKRVEAECENSIKRSEDNCKQIFSKSHDECSEKLSPWVSWLLCWPMRVDYVCDLTWLVVGKAPCDAQAELGTGFGSAVHTLGKSHTGLGSALGSAKFYYKLPEPDVRLDVEDVASAMQNVAAEVKVRAEGAQVLLGLLSKVVALLFLPTILESVKYVKDYIKRPGFDNNCVNKRFKEIDAKRVQMGRKPTLLPLRGMEKKNLILESNKFPNGPERTGYMAPCIRLFFLLIIVVTVLGTDWLYSKTLTVVAKHGRFHLHLQGNHSVHIKVQGTGFVAQMVRSLTSGFNEDADAVVNRTLSNVHCLPRPSVLPMYFEVKIVGLFLLMVAFMLLDHLPKRTRRKICAYYYPKREKQRVIHLYNTMLKARMYYKDEAKKNLQDLIEARRRTQEIDTESSILSKLFSFKIFTSKRTCSLCTVDEKKKNEFVKCIGCQSDLWFCKDCWTENNSTCLLCSIKTEFE